MVEDEGIAPADRRVLRVLGETFAAFQAINHGRSATRTMIWVHVWRAPAPQAMVEIARTLRLDPSTVRHHLKTMLEREMLQRRGERYVVTRASELQMTDVARRVRDAASPWLRALIHAAPD